MSVFRLIVRGGETRPIDFNEYAMVTIAKGILTKRPENGSQVSVTIKYVPLPDNSFVAPVEKSEVLCTFLPGQNDIEIENIYYDSMNPKIYVPEGAEVKFEGNFTTADVFADKDAEEESQSTDTPEDEEDGDFQEEESEA